MGKLTFVASADLMRVIAHSKANACRRPYTGKDAEAGLLLVKDSGVYLMSAAKVPLLNADGSGNLVVYARGHDPRKGDCYDADREACGGDDFAQYLPLNGVLEGIGEGDRIEVRMSKRYISISVRK